MSAMKAEMAELKAAFGSGKSSTKTAADSASAPTEKVMYKGAPLASSLKKSKASAATAAPAPSAPKVFFNGDLVGPRNSAVTMGGPGPTPYATKKLDFKIDNIEEFKRGPPVKTVGHVRTSSIMTMSSAAPGFISATVTPMAGGHMRMPSSSLVSTPKPSDPFSHLNLDPNPDYEGSIHEGLKKHNRWQSMYSGPTIDTYTNIERTGHLTRKYLTTDTATVKRVTSLAQGMIISIKKREQPYIGLTSYIKGAYHSGVVCMSMSCGGNTDWLITDVDASGAFTLRPLHQSFHDKSVSYLACHSGKIVLSVRPTWWIIADKDAEAFVRMAPKDQPGAFITSV